ncbi:MAG: hypothetical protein ABJF88_04765 [Rhodothermales bacterium]
MLHRFRLFFCLCGCLFGLFVSAGCAPSFSPLYRDFDVEPLTDLSLAERASLEAETTTEQDDVYERIRMALAEAGWDEAPPASPNAVSTEGRQLSDWGLYRVLVSLDVVPIGDHHVRVLFHPVRRYFTGGRSKIPYLSSGLRQALLPELNEAFEAQGLYPIGTPRERDEEDLDGT